jgi:hypothetical protein
MAAAVQGDSTVVVLEAVSTQVASVGSTVALLVALWLPDTLEAESAAAAVELALADRAFQVVFQTLPALDLGSLHLGDRHPGNPPMKDALIDP